MAEQFFHWPATHVSVPVPHGDEHAWYRSSSVWPSQSSSALLQTSASTSVRSVQSSPIPVALQTNVPSLHWSPSGPSHGCPFWGKSSSVPPSQSSSRPLHFSTAPGYTAASRSSQSPALGAVYLPSGAHRHFLLSATPTPSASWS